MQENKDLQREAQELQDQPGSAGTERNPTKLQAAAADQENTRTDGRTVGFFTRGGRNVNKWNNMKSGRAQLSIMLSPPLFPHHHSLIDSKN